jgi:hypothetical protein
MDPTDLILNTNDSPKDIAKLIHTLYVDGDLGWDLSSPAFLSDHTGLWGLYQKVDRHLATILLTCKEADRNEWESKRKFIRTIQKKLKIHSFKNSVFNECQEYQEYQE